MERMAETKERIMTSKWLASAEETAGVDRDVKALAGDLFLRRQRAPRDRRLENGDPDQQQDSPDDDGDDGGGGAGQGGGQGSAVPRGRIDLIDIVDFDVQIGLSADFGLQIFEISDVVTDWMNESFQNFLAQFGYTGMYADFDTVVLLDRNGRRRTSVEERVADGPFLRKEQRGLRALSDEGAEQGEDSGTSQAVLFTAPFKGAALFIRQDNQTSVPKQVVDDVQLLTLLDEESLLSLLQNSTVMGAAASYVIDVRSFLNPNSGGGDSGDSSSDSLEFVIIIAIAVACVAFVFLVMAVVWAWQYDRRNRTAFLAGRKENNRNGANGGEQQDAGEDAIRPDHTGSNSTDDDDPATGGSGNNGQSTSSSSPSQKKRAAAAKAAASRAPVENIQVTRSREVQDPVSVSLGMGSAEPYESSIYPESVISEDISTSLSQYYRSGLGGNGGFLSGTYGMREGDRLNDAASISSMESYGYSLDGYAPSLATPIPIDIPALPGGINKNDITTTPSGKALPDPTEGDDLNSPTIGVAQSRKKIVAKKDPAGRDGTHPSNENGNMEATG